MNRVELRRLTVVTRNVRDFEHFDVPILDPFASQGRYSV